MIKSYKDELVAGEVRTLNGRDYVVVGLCSGFLRIRDVETNLPKRCSYEWFLRNSKKVDD